MTLYAIGDIHGHLAKLEAAHALVAEDRARTGAEAAPLIHTGDLVDRGPDSAGVVRWLMAACAADARNIVLKGNHDLMLEHYLQTGPASDRYDPASLHYLSDNVGGGATLASYGVDPCGPPAVVHHLARARIPQSHRAFLAGLPLTHRAGECLFVHAGIRPGVPFEEQDADDLVWIRDEFLYSTRDHGALIVHGHTPVDHPEHHGNRLNIDTGAAWGGPVSAVAIEGRAAWLLTPDGRVFI